MEYDGFPNHSISEIWLQYMGRQEAHIELSIMLGAQGDTR